MIEPEAEDRDTADGIVPSADISLLSIAISLRRIADTIAGNDDEQGLGQLAWNVWEEAEPILKHLSMKIP